MNAQSRRAVRRIACSALALGLIAGAPMFVASAQAQQTSIVDPNAPKAGQSSHDAAIAAAARRDYVTALELSKKAAAEGQPLDAEQVDFISGKAAQQQAAAADTAAQKAKQQEASATAQQIEARQQKDYAQRSKAEQEAAGCSSTPAHIGVFTSAAGEAGSRGDSQFGGKKVSGADPKKCGG
jgi:hypothetical protein